MNASTDTTQPYYSQQPDTGCGFCNSIHKTLNVMTQWLAAPFTSPVSAVSLVLIVGIIVIAAWFWQVVLLQIREEI
jgi:hypothetical protein